jgi:hypothetical protein
MDNTVFWVAVPVVRRNHDFSDEYISPKSLTLATFGKLYLLRCVCLLRVIISCSEKEKWNSRN